MHENQNASQLLEDLDSQPGRPSQLILIRHAESFRNAAKRGTTYFADEYARREVKGIPDHEIPITQAGVFQAEKTGFGLYQRFGVPDYIYHSGYLRTEETLNQILLPFSIKEAKQVKIRIHGFIRERDPGYTYDMTEAEAEAQFPYLKEYWEMFGGFFAAPPGGESLAKVSERVYLFLNMLFRDRIGKKVWVVTHGGTIRVFRYLLERWSYDRAEKWPSGQSPKNCGVTVYDYSLNAQRLILKEYNTIFY